MRLTPVVVAVLLLAGCSYSPPLTDPATQTVTPADVPEDYAYAPGVTEEGVTDPETLAAAHEAVLSGNSYRITSNRTVRYANGTLREQLLVDVALAADGTYLAAAATRGPAAPVFLGRPPANGTYWANGTVYVRKLTRDDRTTYNQFDGPSNGAGSWQYWSRTVPFGGQQATPRGFYGSLFATVPTEVVGDVSNGNATAYRLVGEAPRSAEFVGVTDLRDVRLTATVREDGLVSTLSLRYAGEIDGEPVRVVRTVRYRNVGSTTAERPPWFENAVGG